MDLTKLDYFATSLAKRVTGSGCECPNCGSNKHVVVDRKYLVTELRRCTECRLLYRSPTDSVGDNRKFYQKAYISGFTTKLPSDDDLNRMKINRFSAADHNYGYFIAVLQSLGLGRGSRIFDFGCSWGYGSWQFADAGFDVLSFEISKPRAAFAREKLGLKVLDTLPDPAQPGELAGKFDCFFSSHVIEHVPQPASALKLARALLKPNGYFVALTPNGSAPFRSKNPDGWHHLWGKVHPNLIDDEFWHHTLAGTPMLLAASPVDRSNVARFHQGLSVRDDGRLDGDELMCIARF